MRNRYHPSRCSTALVALALLTTALSATPGAGVAQQSLAPTSPSGQTVTPAFEGWYRNGDGTYSLSFGYFNRNASETPDIPVGENNFVAPGAQNQGQPTHFEARRHWGVFAVIVPADFGEKKVTWTLKFRGQSYAIPASLRPEWEIDAIEGEASADNTPPRLSFEAGGAEGRGPLGITTALMHATVGKPMPITLFVKDDGKAEPVARSASPVDIAWFKHQGAGAVTFAPATFRPYAHWWSGHDFRVVCGAG